MANPRTHIAKIIYSVAYEHINLDAAFLKHLSGNTSQHDAFIKAASFGTLRFYHRLKFLLDQLLEKPIKQKEAVVECLLLSALHECLYMQTATHACVSENVNAVVALGKGWAKGLCNAILRKLLRETDRLLPLAERNDIAHYSHPAWFIQALDNEPHKQQILEANNLAGPLTLRVNRQKIARETYLQQLRDGGMSATATHYSPDGIICQQATDITSLPGFDAGQFSVQDEAAQLAAQLVNPQAGERVLDACAAPGGKTGHILECQPDIDLLAIDRVEQRLQLVNENLARLGLAATVQQGDAAQPDLWWDQRPFDRILLDAPCSATGVIRRHPDIKLLRRAEDIARLVKTQAQILNAIWPLLKSGGMLLYATCSVLNDENNTQIQEFIATHADARARPLDVAWGQATPVGRQIWPGEAQMDGFFYSLIYKLP